MENKTSEALLEATPLNSQRGGYFDGPSQWRSFVIGIAALIVCFGIPLFRLFAFAWNDELYSYIVLMPAVSWYLVRLKKPAQILGSQPLRGPGAVLLMAGVVLMGVYLWWAQSDGGLAPEDRLAIATLAFLLCLSGVSCIFLGRIAARSLMFPLGILVFMVPLPSAARDFIVVFLQHGSALVADGLFKISGMPHVRDELVIYLPGVRPLQVAPECSGIHSSWILLITSLMAGYLFLRSPWKRGVLAAAVIPLALLRNGFRVYTLGELCVHAGQWVIDSPIHHKGGPVFFVLSLVPFFILLVYLRRSERPGEAVSGKS